MRAPPRIWCRLVDALRHRESATSLALCRMALGAAVLQVSLEPLAGGVWSLLFVDPAVGGARQVVRGHWLVGLLGAGSVETAHALVGLAVLGGLSLLLGLGHRVGALLAGQALLALFSMNPAAGGGHDLLLTNALFLIMLSPASQTLSLVSRLRTGRWTSTRPVVAWPRYLFVGQLAVVYFMTGAQKLGPGWMPWGNWEALYRVLVRPTYALHDFTWVAHVFELTQALTLGTWLFEVTWPLVPLAFWFRATRTRPGRLRSLFNRLDVRRLYLLAGLGLHAGVTLTLDVGPFAPVLLPYYLCLVHPDELRGLRRRWAPGLRAISSGVRGPR